jgi:hypothetical protein
VRAVHASAASRAMRAAAALIARACASNP